MVPRSMVSVSEEKKVHINYKGALTTNDFACKIVDKAHVLFVQHYQLKGGDQLTDRMIDKIFDKSVSRSFSLYSKLTPHKHVQKVYKGGLRMLGSSKTNKGPYKLLDENGRKISKPTLEQLEACSIRPNLHNADELALHETLCLIVDGDTDSASASSVAAGGGPSSIVVDGVDDDTKAAVVAFHAVLLERMPNLPRAISRMDVLGGDTILIKFRDASFCPIAFRRHARNKPTLYISINSRRCVIKCYDEECRDSSKMVVMDTAIMGALQNFASRGAAPPPQANNGHALRTYIESLPLIRTQIPHSILPRRITFGGSWETDQFMATELVDGGRRFQLHTCQEPENAHSCALVTFKRDRSTGCVCFRTVAADGRRQVMPHCAQHPQRSMWTFVTIDLFVRGEDQAPAAAIPPPETTHPLHDSPSINARLNDLAHSHLDTGLAELYVELQGNRFVRYLVKDDAWATFDRQNWDIGPRGSGAVGSFLKNACIPVLRQAITTFMALRPAEQFTKEDGKFVGKLKDAKRHIEGTVGQNCVVQQLQTIACMVAKSDADFRGLLNQQKHLFAFTNGVYDMNTGHFRQIEPEDMISRNCGRAYLPEEVTNQEKRTRIKDVIYGIFSNDEEVGDFFMLELAGALGGHNLSQTMSCLLGGGANGKSTLLSLILSAFGNYVKTMYSSWITGADKDSDGCTNQLVFVEHARLIVLSELNEKEKVNKRRMKMLTGGDVIPIRGIREGFRDFRARAKLMCFTNYMPAFVGQVLYADMRRLRVYPMKMRYVAEPDPANRFEARIDRWLEINIAKLGDAFLGMLFDLYPQYVRVEGAADGSHPLPALLVEATTEAFNNMDPIRSFVLSMFVRTQDGNCHVTTDEAITGAREFETRNETPFPAGRTKLLKELDKVFATRELTNDERRIEVGTRTVRGWRFWKRIEEDE